MKLFLSFSGTLDKLKAGENSDQDLSQGLFLFGCRRSHFFSYCKDRPPTPEYIRLRNAIVRAEVGHRVEWGLGGSNRPPERASELLIRHGLKPLDSKSVPCGKSRFISAAIEQANTAHGTRAVECVC